MTEEEEYKRKKRSNQLWPSPLALNVTLLCGGERKRSSDSCRIPCSPNLLLVISILFKLLSSVPSSSSSPQSSVWIGGLQEERGAVSRVWAHAPFLSSSQVSLFSYDPSRFMAGCSSSSFSSSSAPPPSSFTRRNKEQEEAGQQNTWWSIDWRFGFYKYDWQVCEVFMSIQLNKYLDQRKDSVISLTKPPSRIYMLVKMSLYQLRHVMNTWMHQEL